MINVIINGAAREVSEGTTIRALIEQAKLSPDKVAIELNRRFVKTEKYDMVLSANDQVEIVTFVGGG